MKQDPTHDLPHEQLVQLADALVEIRDFWVSMSLVMKDWVTDSPSPARDEVMTEVERYLRRIQEFEKRDSE